jgi:DDE superfamily endonuclease
MEKARSRSLNGFTEKTSQLDLKRIWRVFWHVATLGKQCLCPIKNYSKKKTLRYKERDEKKRSVFLEQIRRYPKEALLFVDESRIDSYLYLPYGWSKRGEKIFGEISGKHFARDSFVAAKCQSKILVPLCFQGTCNTKLFDLWIEQFLVPELNPGQAVILDNASFHKSEKTRTLIE